MFENIQLAFQGVFGHKLRSFLTMLGIIIGIASIITIISTIKGTNEQIKQNLIGSGSNIVNVQLYQNDWAVDMSYQTPDGIRVLRQLRREGCASEIFLISAFVSDHMLAEATELRVDYFLPKPFAFEALFDRMRGTAAQSARSALHPPSLLVTSILHELGMSPGLKGYGYIHDAALLALDDPSLLHAVTKVIYPCVARRNGTTAFCVERAIRHAIEITWERGSRDAWDRYFGHLCADGGKPANGMFLAELVEALKYEKLG